MRIGRVAARSETSVETIRYYERIRVLAAPARSASGYRQYSEEHLQQLMFVRHCRDLGFSISEIRSLQALANDPKGSCTEITALAKAHLLDVRSKLLGLRRLERTLARLISSCEGRRVADCRILKELGVPVVSGATNAHPP